MKTLLLTRPKSMSEQFANMVAEAMPGRFSTVISPLLDIRAEPCSADLSGAQALLFTSRYGVAAFCARSGERHLPALCVGASTARDAKTAGFSVMSANGNVADLAALASQSYIPGAGTMVHFRGANTAGDLSGSLIAEGIEAEERIIYDQVSLDFNEMARAALASGAPIIAPLFSPRTAAIFARQITPRDNLSNTTILAMSDAVAACIQNVNAKAFVLPEPNAETMLRAIATV